LGLLSALSAGALALKLTPVDKRPAAVFGKQFNDLFHYNFVMLYN